MNRMRNPIREFRTEQMELAIVERLMASQRAKGVREGFLIGTLITFSVWCFVLFLS